MAFGGQDLDRYRSSAVEEFPTRSGPADFALCDQGAALAVVEAKKVTLGPQNVLTQAQRYSEGFSVSPKDLRRWVSSAFLIFH